MTAINIVFESGIGYLFTDGAGIAPTGELVREQEKVVLLECHRAAIATRGDVRILPSMASMLTIASPEPSFDLMIPRLETVARLTAGLSNFGPFDAFIVGWSDEYDQAVAFGISSLDNFGEPLKLCGPLAFMSSPDARAAHEAAGVDPMKRGDAIRAIELQRRQWQEMPGHPGAMHTIGCFLQETMITRDGVSQRVVHRWPDRIGETINPFSTVPAAA